MAIKNRLIQYRERLEDKTTPGQLSNYNLTTRQMYTKLRGLYDNNGVYDAIKRFAYEDSKWIEALKPLRTVAHRSVEFYVAKCLQNATVTTDNQSVIDALDDFRKWSNWEARSRVMLRWLGRDGDLFVKTQGNDSRVWMTLIDAYDVTAFSVDARDNLTSIRIDKPIVINERKRTYTEYWTSIDNYMAVWEHDKGENEKLERLGTPKEYHFLGEFGIDFVPFVHVKFSDVGEKRGKSAISHALDKIDEANREATRLTQMLFRYNRPLMTVSANSVNPIDGSPLPVEISEGAADSWLNDESILKLSGQARVDSLVPNLNYEQALAILRDMMSELEQDLPELKYYSLTGDLSGKAVTMLLAGALDRAAEVQSNMVQGLIRLDMMALTIGKFWGLFPGLSGSFDDGKWEHEITTDEMFSDDMSDRATTLQMLVAAKMPLSAAMKFTGFSEEEIAEATEAANAESVQRNQSLAAGILGTLNNPNAQQ